LELPQFRGNPYLLWGLVKGLHDPLADLFGGANDASLNKISASVYSTISSAVDYPVRPFFPSDLGKGGIESLHHSFGSALDGIDTSANQSRSAISDTISDVVYHSMWSSHIFSLLTFGVATFTEKGTGQAFQTFSAKVACPVLLG
jgi:hypothetical protein